ncbi:MAG TPA: hypothetical protein VLT86_15660 [Vicinamibacterales bacterium]|nr:hypothetical protein [Vicinamibacterales bacterium]
MLTPSTPIAPAEPWLPWLKREWLLVVITTGVAVDWLPWVLSPYVPGLGPLSGTRLLVLPGLLLAALLTPAWIVRPHVLGVAYLATLLVGGGLGWIADTVELSRLVAIAVNGVVLLYFLSIRSLVSIRRVLALTAALSALVPLVQCLAKLAVIPPDMLAARGVVPVPGDTRIFSIFDSTTVGLVPLTIAASLGGLIFITSARRRTFASAALAVGLIGLGGTSAALAQQRSGVLAYAVSILTALVLYLAAERRHVMWMIKLGAVLCIAAIVGAYYSGGVISRAEERFADTAAYQSARDLRVSGFTTFLADLAASPVNPVPKGHQSLLHRTGVEPHLLLSEAYYEGGPLFLAAIIAILVRFASACLTVLRSGDPNARAVGICLCAFACGAAIQVSLQTALALRLLPLILGVGIAARRATRTPVRARRAPTSAHDPR